MAACGPRPCASPFPGVSLPLMPPATRPDLPNDVAANAPPSTGVPGQPDEPHEGRSGKAMYADSSDDDVTHRHCMTSSASGGCRLCLLSLICFAARRPSNPSAPAFTLQIRDWMATKANFRLLNGVKIHEGYVVLQSPLPVTSASRPFCVLVAPYWYS